MVRLSRPYTARFGQPTVDRVDPRIFALTYFHHCMSCTFCHDSCCQYGATVEQPKYQAILKRAPELEAFIGIPHSDWFHDENWWSDPDYPGDHYTRTQVRDTAHGERCVFIDAEGRGCLLHKFALERDLSVHEIKPMACNLFPVLWDDGALIVPLEIDDQTLICIDQGWTLYRSARNDLLYYFGSDLIAELDGIEREHTSSQEKAGMMSLAIV